MVKLILLLKYILPFSCVVVYAQPQSASDSVIVLLNRVGGVTSSFAQPGKMLADDGAYSGIPDSLEKYGVFEFSFQIRQHFHQQYLNGGLTQEEYQTYRSRYHIDNRDVTDQWVDTQVGVLSGIINDKKIIWCDTDNDEDFSDETPAIYDFDKLVNLEKDIPRDSVPTLLVQFEYFYKDEIHQKDQYIKLFPYNKGHRYPDSRQLEKDLQVYISADQHHLGYFNNDSKTYKISVSSYLGGGYENSIYVGEKEGEYYQYTPWLQLGHTFSLNEDRYKIQSVSQFCDTLILVRQAEEEKIIGFREGEYVSLTGFQSISPPQHHFEPSLINKEYILLDFWGTWCKPCIQGLPKLKEFITNHQDKLMAVSIAYDDEISKVRDFVQNREMDWLHKFEDRKDSDNAQWVQDLKVDCFPTFLLIDKNFKIVSRGCGEEALLKIGKVMQ